MARSTRALTLALLVCLMISLALPARAAGSTVLTITQPQTLPDVGQTFTVAVSISGNPGLSAAQLTLRYDDAVVRCTSARTGEVLSGLLSASNPYDTKDGVSAIVAAAGTAASERDGVLALFVFEVLRAGDPGIAPGEVILTDAGGAALTWTVQTVYEAPSGGEAAGGAASGGISGGTSGEVSGGESEATFSDVPATHWASAEIARAAQLGLIRGYGDGSFHPGAHVTRAQFVTMLYRLAGEPEVTAALPFSDVSPDSRFAPAIAWAAANGYVNGRTADTFDPNGTVTREQAVAILYRYSGGQSGMETLFSAIYRSQFTDSGSVATYARAAFDWAIYHGVVSGTSATTLSPKREATRAQIAVILLHYLDTFAQGGT